MNGDPVSRRLAEEYVAEQSGELRNRYDRLVEYIFWDTVKGGDSSEDATIYYPDGTTATVATNVPSANKKAAVAASWATTSTDIVAQLKGYKLDIAKVGGSDLAMVLNSNTFDYLRNNEFFQKLFTDRVRDEIANTGQVSNFLGLTIYVYDMDYSIPAASLTDEPYIADDEVVIFAQNAVRLLECSPNDNDAPQNYTGIFTKTFRQDNPSNDVWLATGRVLPVLVNPSAVIVLQDVTAT